MKIETRTDSFGTEYQCYRESIGIGHESKIDEFIEEARKRPNEHFVLFKGIHSGKDIYAKVFESGVTNIIVTDENKYNQEIFCAENYIKTENDLNLADLINREVGQSRNVGEIDVTLANAIIKLVRHTTNTEGETK